MSLFAYHPVKFSKGSHADEKTEREPVGIAQIYPAKNGQSKCYAACGPRHKVVAG
jgi:hypothetical protein